MAPRRLGALLALAAALFLGSCGDSKPGGGRIRLATTTSAHDTGLLDWLRPEIEAQTGMRLDDVAVGSGEAFELARRGDADLVLVHDRKREDAFVAAGEGIDRRDVMWNDFVLVGPKADPAGIRGLPSAGEALRKIAEAKVTFVSRGDDSGTHSREKELWEKAGGRPAWPGYLEAGRGQGPTLLLADEKRAYTLADRGTWVTMRKNLELEILVEGDAALRNEYGAILVNPAKQPAVNAKGARAMLDYLTSPEGQARIGAFKIDGEVLFHPHSGG